MPAIRRCALIGRRRALDATREFSEARYRVVVRHELGEDDSPLPSPAELATALRLEEVDEVWFAAPPLDGELVRAVLQACFGVRRGYRVVDASRTDLENGGSGSRLRRLSTDDLVRREAPEVGPARFEGRDVLVTGAAGSIGSEIASRLSRLSPATLVLFDLDANGLYRAARRLERAHPGLAVHAEVGDVRDRARVRAIVEGYRPLDLFHAAALKQVPLLESAPGEAVKTNVLGTRLVAESACAAGVERFVFVSTDKAVLPSSVMGATKRIGEQLVRSFVGDGPTRFTVVRFGNVIGTSGSVVPIFEDQIAGGGPLTVTDRAVRRYFMTVSEATGLVLGAAAAPAGSVRVLEMGASIPVRELAECLITLAGARPHDEIAIRYSGLRPGEKLSERLWTDEEVRASSRVGDRVLEFDSPPPPPAFGDRVTELVEAARAEDSDRVRELLGAWIVPVNPRDASDRERDPGRDRRRTRACGSSPPSRTPGG